MALSELNKKLVDEFRARVRGRFGGDARVVAVQELDREDGSTLSTRFQVAPHLWLEAAVRPFVPQLRAGILTDDRWANEELEEKIEESGDTMQEFVEMGFEEAGLEWLQPTVEHYRDQGVYFCFATALDLKALEELGSEAVFDKFCRMIEGYAHAFWAAIRKANGAAAK